MIWGIYKMKLLNKIKNKNSEKENTENTVSDLINIEDIRGELLYTKNGYVFSYIKVQPISIDLKTNSEKENTENTVSDLINIEDIRGELLYTKNGYVFSYIKVQPISIDLKTKEEKNY